MSPISSRRFFIDPSNINGQKAVLKGSDVHHLRDVLRLAVGDEIVIFDGSTQEYDARIEKMGKDSATLFLFDAHPHVSESALQVTLAQCILKGAKMDLVIQKATELGVARIIPIISERTVARPSIDEPMKEHRWHRIAVEAAQQSGRAAVPEIMHPRPFLELLTDPPSKFDIKVIPWEGEDEKSLRYALRNIPKIKSILIVIGPEGGFTAEEVEAAKSFGFDVVTLGQRILRSETAAIASLACLFYELEN